VALRLRLEPRDPSEIRNALSGPDATGRAPIARDALGIGRARPPAAAHVPADNSRRRTCAGETFQGASETRRCSAGTRRLDSTHASTSPSVMSVSKDALGLAFGFADDSPFGFAQGR